LAEKRYYWIQLKEGFFKQKEIKKLRKRKMKGEKGT